ncbi:hypothetical protein FB451DRAFT_442814 [Mycena latifolia]|nr:hypothetical protein FB451DRAFT_442814 [Mycena latifolia]
MPPKKRQNTSTSTASTMPIAQTSRGARPHQTSKGLLTMPVELLHLISLYFGCPVEVPVGHLGHTTDPALPLEYYDRSDALRALSQTCYALRLTFLPMLWECMNICVKSRTGKDSTFWKSLGDQLKRTSEGLVHELELLSYIGTVNVILTRYSSAEVLPPFARCLTLMPNMHTLQIIHAHTAMTTHLKNGFANTRLTNVRKIILPSWAHEVLRCCPEVTYVICVDGSDSSKLVSAIAKCCKKVEILEGFVWHDEKLMKRIIKAAPNLTEINFDCAPSLETIKSLSVFKKLTAIRLGHITSQEAIDSGSYSADLPQNLQKCIEVTKDFLRKQPGATKHLRIRYVAHWTAGNWYTVRRGRIELSAVVEEISLV